MTTPSNMALTFNAEKVGDSSHASGRKFVIRVKPGEAPEEFTNAAVGSMWKVVVVRMDENEDAVPPQQPEDKQQKRTIWTMPAPQQAALLCQRADFQNWLNGMGSSIVDEEETAKQFLYKHFNITTRAALKDVPEWLIMVRRFQEHLDEERYGDNLR